MDLVRKTARGKVDGALSYVLSDATVDRYGDIIEPDGWLLDSFRSNPIALFNHSPNQPIGQLAQHPRRGRAPSRRFRAGDDRAPAQRTDEMRRPDRTGHPARHERRVSAARERAARPEAAGLGGSATSGRSCSKHPSYRVPANPAALQLARSTRDQRRHHNPCLRRAAATGRETVTENRHACRDEARIEGNSTWTSNSPSVSRSRTGRSRLNAARDKLVRDQTSDPEHDIETADGLDRARSPSRSGASPRCKRHRAVAWHCGAQQEVLPPLAAPAVNRRPLGLPAKDTSRRSILRTTAWRSSSPYARGMPIEQVLAERYPDDEQTRVVTRAAIAGATTTDAGWAQELVQVGAGRVRQQPDAGSRYSRSSPRWACR